MKKRLLFVDDEPNVLNGLRRSLHGMREVWDMQFVESAAAALQALEKDPYDAIISDMRMPLMDGADLLDQVKQFYPEGSPLGRRHPTDQHPSLQPLARPSAARRSAPGESAAG